MDEIQQAMDRIQLFFEIWMIFTCIAAAGAALSATFLGLIAVHVMKIHDRLEATK